MDEPQRNKSHKSKTVGNKAAKKDALRKRRAGIELEQNRGSNVKAFQGPASGSHKAQKFYRSIEKKETALHVPTLDKTLRHVVAEPPLLVAVVGPPGVGKTTLIRSMVKFYSNRNLTSVRGPITVIAGRSRRITFMECPNTLAAMCDVAKVADLVLLMVDGSYGFEMETFEFLNIAQVHGFPKMFGVVSHLDSLKTGKALKKRKKFLRHRFWHEVAAGAKLLCLSPMVRGMYRPTDVLNLHRLLICVEPKIQAWRNTHSCVVMDRMEDITDPDVVAAAPLHSRTVAFYGYARGKPMKPGQLVHIPGLGDFPVSHLSHQPDPCQLDKFAGDSKEGGNHRMRHLSLKQKKLYAPYCDVGGISYDDDAIYIQEDAEKGAIERSGEGLQLLRELQHARPMDAAQTKLRVAAPPRQRRPMNFRDDDTMELDMEEVRMPSDQDGEDDDDDDDWSEDGARGDVVLDSDSDADESGLSGRRGQPPQRRAPQLSDFGAAGEGAEEGEAGEEDAGDDDDDGAATLAPRLLNDADAIRLNKVQHDWSDPALLRSLKDLCVTGNWEAGEDGDDGAGEAEEAEEAENSKGYTSSDDEFEKEARGERPMTRDAPRRGRSRAADDDNDGGDGGSGSDADGSDSDGAGRDADGGLGLDVRAGARRPGAAGLAKTNALASIGYGAGRSNGQAGRYGAHGASSPAAGDEDEDAYDGFNILDDDDDDGGEVAGDAGPTRSSGLGGGVSAELDDLVSSFLARSGGARRSGGRAAGTPALDGETGITFFDAATRYERDDDGNGDDADGHRPPRGAHRRHVNPELERHAAAEAAAESAVREGGELTAAQERLLQKKMAKKRAFNDEYDTGDVDGGKNTTFSYYHQLSRQVEEKKEQINEALDEVGDDVEKKIHLVGYFSGLYVRFVVESVPVEFLQSFDPTVPLIAGGVNAGEDEFRIVHARIKRHRWFPKILKAQDPLLLSMGWRRFQTQPIFSTEDPNGRCRYLKYTPLHMHCLAAFYAPVAPPNTGFLAIPVRDPRVASFRIPCTGYTIGNDVSTSIVKKLKLTGTPAKVEKTTAFVKGMFSSDVEAAKFIGAKVKAVSGIRGIIKSVLKGKNGLVRATFEDKIFPSDIVFIRAWKSVEPPRYCSMQRNLLDPEWVGMRTMRELRLDYNVPLPRNGDSEYTEIKRRHRVAEADEDAAKQKILLSRNLKMQLPYDMKEDFIPMSKSTALQERIKGATTVAPEPREQRRQALLDTFADRADAMTEKKEAAKKRARERSAKEAAKEQEAYVQGLKKAKKDTARMREFRTQHKSRK